MSTLDGKPVVPGIYYHGNIETSPNLHWTAQVWPASSQRTGPFTAWSTDRYVWLKLTKCPDAFPVYSKREVYPGFRRQAWVVGCSKRYCEVCNQEKRERKKAKWASRLRLMIDWWSANEGTVVFKTLTVHDRDYPDGHPELRKWVQKLLRRLRTKTEFRFKYWFITEEGSKTGRLHAHLFFFLQKGQKFGIINDVMDKYWQRHHLAYVSHHRPVDSGKMAANYAAKYGTKAIGLRTCNSRFGWIDFMNKRRSEWLGIDEGGERRWVVVDEEEALRSQQGVLRRSPGELSRTLVDFTVFAVVDAGTPTLSPLKAVEGGLKLCGVKGEPIAMLTMSASKRLLPETCILSGCSPYVQARRSRVFAAALALHRTLLTTSNPPDL